MPPTAASSAGLMLAAAGQDLFINLLPWLGALLVIVIVGGVAIFAAKRLLRGGDAGSADGFTLQGLRDLHASGELSDDEFARAKAAMIGQVKRDAMADSGSSAEGAEAEMSSSQVVDKNANETGTAGGNDGPISR